MEQLAPDVSFMRGLPPNANSYVVGDVLVNAGTRFGGGRLVRHFDHGKPLRDPDRFRAFVGDLPR